MNQDRSNKGPAVWISAATGCSATAHRGASRPGGWGWLGPAPIARRAPPPDSLRRQQVAQAARAAAAVGAGVGVGGVGRERG